MPSSLHLSNMTTCSCTLITPSSWRAALSRAGSARNRSLFLANSRSAASPTSRLLLCPCSPGLATRIIILVQPLSGDGAIHQVDLVHFKVEHLPEASLTKHKTCLFQGKRMLLEAEQGTDLWASSPSFCSLGLNLNGGRQLDPGLFRKPSTR